MVIKIKQVSHFPLSPDPVTLSMGLTNMCPLFENSQMIDPIAGGNGGQI